MERCLPNLNVDILFLKIRLELRSQQSFKVDQLEEFMINLRPLPDAGQRSIIFFFSGNSDFRAIYGLLNEEKEGY